MDASEDFTDSENKPPFRLKISFQAIVNFSKPVLLACYGSLILKFKFNVDFKTS